MTELIDKMKLLEQIAEFGREIPKDQVIGVIARQESVEVEDRPKDDLISRAEAVKRLLLCKQSRAKIVSRYDMGFVDGLSHAINILDLVPLVYIPSINIVDLAPSADRPKGEWIPVGEKLPDIEQDVLATTTLFGIREVTFAWRTIDGGWLVREGGQEATSNDILAWMPLPEPYKGGEDE